MNDSNQENTILKKRLNTFKNAKGALYGLPDELIIDLVRAWERWPGSAKSFYQGIGIKKQQMGFIIKKGKRLFKEGAEKLGPFIPIEVKPNEDSQKAPMILNWDKKNSISFYQVDHLVEFLKKAA
jgi:hypothetical protein